MKNKFIRLSKIISHAGVCSRKAAEELIRNGHVKINNKVFTEYLIQKDLIKSLKVKDKKISNQEIKVWLFNKPVGYVSSNKEQFSQKSLFRLIPKDLPRVVSVGRLDIETQGLMILTNNPSLSTFLEDPKNKIERKYLVKVFGKITNDLDKITKKQLLINGILYKNVTIKVLTNKINNNIMEIKLTEGKNREIRKIMNHFDLKVKKLTRVSFGPFNLNNLKIGKVVQVENLVLHKFFKSIGFNNENYFR